MANRKGVARKIAEAMVDVINSHADFAGVIVAEQVADPKRRVEELPMGESLIDVIGQGASYEARNRRSGIRTYIVWVAVHAKLPGGIVTDDALDEATFWAEKVQETFHQDAYEAVTVEGQEAVLVSSEPFPVSRQALFGAGLHMSTMRFDWQFLR